MKKLRRRHRPAPDLLAREGAFGKRLRRLEEEVGLQQPSRKIEVAIVFDLPLLPTDQQEGPTVGAYGTAYGCYRLGAHRHVVFWGPRGVTQKKVERLHRQAVADLMAAHPEYSEAPKAPPYHAPPQEESVGELRVQLMPGIPVPELINPN